MSKKLDEYISMQKTGKPTSAFRPPSPRTPLPQNTPDLANRTLFKYAMYHDKLRAPANSIIVNIRSPQYATSHNIRRGDIGWIAHNNINLFRIKIVNYWDQKIAEIPLEILQKDILPIEIFTPSQYAKELNQLYAQINIPAKNTIHSLKRVFLCQIL